MMATLADSICANALSAVGFPYVLGNEPWYNVGDEPSDDAKATDCSGLVYGVMRRSGAKWANGQTFQRVTADGYYHLSKKITAPANVGDLGFVLNSKRTKAVHVILYVGNGEAVEARGRKWGVVKYKLPDPVNGAEKRVHVWGRLPWLNVGALTTSGPDTEPEIIDSLFLKARHTKITGAMICSLRSWYGIPPAFTLAVLGKETSLGDPEVGGRLVPVHNYGAMRKPSKTYPWSEQSNGVIRVGGADYLTFPDAWKGITAWGRLIKLGPPRTPGSYLAAAQAGDFAAFGRIYNPGGGDEYVASLRSMHARFLERARAAGLKW